MQYAVYLPNFGDYFDPRVTAELAKDAEAAGWDGFFLWDHLTHPNHLDQPFADPWIQLAAAALATQRMRLGLMVTPLPRRRPWKLAKEVVTIDHLSGGRLIFAAGLGTHAVEFGNLGEEADPLARAEMLDEGLEVLAGLCSGQEYKFEGKHYHVKPTRFLPGALQQPRVPVWIAGVYPKKGPFARALRWDGYFPLGGLRDNRFLTPDEIAEIGQAAKDRRPAGAAFDLVASGWTDKMDLPAAARFTAEYADAGATWYMEALDPWHYAFDTARAIIRRGPPRG